MIDWFQIAAVAAAFVLAGLVKGVIGMGLPTVAMGLLGLAMPPAQAAALLLIPSFVTNVWQFAAGPKLMALIRRLWPLLLGVGAGMFAGAGLMTGGNSRTATAALGAALAAYALVGFSPWYVRVPRWLEPLLSPVIGFVTGVITAATGIFVIPAVPYLQTLELEREELVQALGLCFVTATVGLALLLAYAGALQPSFAGGSLLALAPTALGMLIGQHLRTRISPRVFRTCFFGGLLLLGTHLMLRGLL